MKIELIHGKLKDNNVINVIVEGVSTFVDASQFKSKEIKKFMYELETALNSCMEIK
jgi:hypothetical protein